jgi:zinc protease
MRTIVRIVAGGLAMTLAAGAAAEERGKTSAVLLPVQDDATIAMGVWFKVGSQNDPPGKEGLAYLTAQLLSEGGTTKNAYEEILRKLYPMASGYSVRVDKEMTTFGGRTHKDNTAKYMELLTDAFLRPAFSQGDFDRLKSDQINYLEKNLRYSSDEELAKAALHAFVFENTGYENIPQGTVAGLQSITLDDVKAFYAQYYTRDNAVVALGGGFSKDVQKQFEAAVQSLPAGRPPVAAAPKPAAVRGQQVTFVAKPNADATICFGFPIDVSRGEKDFYALWVANSWLGEHRNSSSHLYQVIREARGLNYGNYSYIEAFPEGGFRRQPPTGVGRRQQMFEVWIRTLPNKHAHFALRAAMREVKDLVDGGMTQKEFDLTREFLSKYVLHFAETTTNRLGYAVDDQFYELEGSHLAKFREAMKTLTLADVNAAIRKHLQYENLKIAIVTGEAESLKQAMISNAPSPMVYDNPKSDAIVAEDKEIAMFPLGVKAADVRVVPVEQMFAK